ncbi:hypothetical protein DENIS_1985 [Desulfonema ishimotonii]|uniref:Heavy-metal chelation domain-containing protein n=1 Tax=Desulfonema ishimotonii TaxID=45657 RepID=A0A401FVN8_9BACT|nr:DUF364 domain-containing protein [Desulfonema ishimotonii]GBC61025.1 hypothetical protein DENIS_1985 [Desulfonema ishimotonii]
MELNNRLHGIFEEKAGAVTVETLCMGLGYTAVTTSDGGIGISYTCFEHKKSCSLNKNYRDYEGLPASELLQEIRSTDTLRRSMALALINALNYEYALSLPEDKKNNVMFDSLGVGQGTRVAMVGFFGPLMRIFEERGADLQVIDASKHIGQKADFYDRLRNWAEVLFLTSTSVLNNTTEEVLGAAGDGVKTVMLGPSTPMIPQAFEMLPVRMLAGTVPVEKAQVLKVIRHGTGTPVIQRFSKKVFCACTD